MTAKYQPLSDYLKARPATEAAVTLSFARISEIIGGPLPRSAFKHREWWSNQSDISTRPQARAWIEAGYQVESVHQRRDSGSVRFVRRDEP